MWDRIVAVIYSLIIHIILIAVLLSGSDLTTYFSTTPQNATNGVDEKQVQLELERLIRAKTITNAQQQTQQYALAQKQLEYEQVIKQAQARLQELQQEQAREQQQIELLEQRHQAEQTLLEQLQSE